MRFGAAFVAVAILAAAIPALAGGTGPSATPAEVTSGFYAAYLGLKQGGIPDTAARARLAPFLSPTLDRLLTRGEAAEAQYRKATSNMSPPLLEGDIFSSLFEGATSFAVRRCSTAGHRAKCEVALAYEEKGQKPTRWSDTARLVEAPAGWRLDDIAYGGTWDFGNKGTLSENLKFAIKNAGGNAE